MIVWQVNTSLRGHMTELTTCAVKGYFRTLLQQGRIEGTGGNIALFILQSTVKHVSALAL